MRLTGITLVLTLLLGVLGLTTMACAGGGAAKPAQAQTDASGRPIVSWDKAMDYVGQDVVVEGMVIAVKETKGAIFVNFHSDYKHTFSIFVPGSSKETIKSGISGFPQSVQDKKVRIRGTVKKYEKDGAVKPEIELTDPTQLTIL
ncbi:MAG: hypothetical protein GEEBNDBF_01616 [bacterium]|nr:hypothetical protein [bacterium]